MKMSKLFVQTLREFPSDAEVISHKMLGRAGYIKKLAPGVYTYMPLMWRVLKKVEKIEKLGYGNLPICIAKTQYSFSDNAKNIECAEKFNININDVELKAGAGFIVIYTGKIMTMPGLPQTPAAENIDISNDGEISGIF